MRHFDTIARRLGCLLALVVAGLPAPASAQSAGSYEAGRLERALSLRGLSVADGAEGRTIRRIVLVREEVFAEDELVLDLEPTASAWRTETQRHPLTIFNSLHALTRPQVIMRELPFAEGEPYSELRAEEGTRNLRSLGIFALVRIVPVRVPGDVGAVDVVVFSRDIWSLRLETDFQGTSGNYRLLGQLTERNIFGFGKQGTLRFEVRPLTFSVGEVYYDWRLFGGKRELYQSTDLIVHRRTGEVEGAITELRIGRPFYKLAHRWSYSIDVRDLRLVSRALDGRGEVIGADLADGADPAEGCDLAVDSCVPQVFAFRSTRASGAVHRRIGHTLRHTLSAGYVFRTRSARAIAETGLAPELREAFAEELLPVARTLSYPYLRHRFDMPRFGVFSDLGAYGVSENVQLGPYTDASVGLPLGAFGSTDDGLLLGGELGYVLQLGRTLVDVSSGGSTRRQGREWLDHAGTAQVRGASAPWGPGRVAWLLRWEGRREDSARTLVSLDAADGLRGYPVGSLNRRGASRAFGNVELRSLPWALDVVHIGAVMFYDGGTIYEKLDEVRYHHGAGLGLRVMFPQLNRFVLRVDGGVALDAPGFSVVASYGSGQGLPLTASEDRQRAADIRAQ